ncbi:Methyltransferase domain-containing protein [Anaerovibrio lipolyticus DSM 3074]|uniref:Methyltransferase domain-containing protein n=1 Tax=Anaerovibrio lipolyticus DSM 3074 TaxID=1120997 RepID=A0A1M6G2Y7_9FIRM|nr:methyltransferase domain-containing protein [Anaerovibrio lipolyticus]SHJ04280.1 Methyltransferase domain-containing protein [Anaerovibrio lipolyticus DSM 3074]
MLCRLVRYNFLDFEVHVVESACKDSQNTVSIEGFCPDENLDSDRYYAFGLIFKVTQVQRCICAFKLQGELELLNTEYATADDLYKESLTLLYEILDEKIEELERILHCTIVKPPLSGVIGEKGKKKCACCGSVFDEYVPLSPYYKEQAKKNHVSDDFRSEMVNKLQYSCPVCGAADRERAYAICMKKELAKDACLRVLDIAPSMALGNFICRTFPNVEYRTADLFMPGVDYKIDIMHMDIIPDGSIDFFICSHVLEHVSDDMQAMFELRRILSAEGKGILVVPIDLNAEGIDEDPSCSDEGERWRRFYQNDHIRRYSRRGFLNRIHRAGFNVKECDREYFGREVMKKNGLIDTSCVYLVSKNEE